MNEFDIKAPGWDSNPMHIARSQAVAKNMMELIPLNKRMTALEYGAGTGITSFILKDHLKHITMMDNSRGMVSVMTEKIHDSKAENLEALFFDLEHNDFKGGKFDLIFTQLVLHHVVDIESIIHKFSMMMNPGGYLAIADLYTEDGLFHGDSFTGHKGFDPDVLGNLLLKNNFKSFTHRQCFTIEKMTEKEEKRNFNVFLLTGIYPG